ncbi:MAG: hypothetical protein ABL876_00140 [Chitinophagaceae bacterium]
MGSGSRLYTVSFTEVAVTAAQDLFEITPADDKPIAIHGLFFTQSTEIGDAQEEFIRFQVIRGHTTSGSGGTAPTPVPLNPNDTAAGFTAEVNNTTIASAGTTTVLHAGTFNERIGLELWLPPEVRWMASQANTTLVVRTGTTVADSVTVSGTLYVEELI